MAKLKEEFQKLFNRIYISESNDLKEKRDILENDIKDRLPDILNEKGINLNKSDIRMIDQGSYKYNTTIKSKVIDRDVAVIIPLDIVGNNDPREIKSYLKESIDLHQRTVKIKNPCVTASYFEDGEEWMHIDLPLYADNGIGLYLARGKENSEDYKWEEADPDGLNCYMINGISGNDQLRRIICFIKKWRNHAYENSDNSHEVPPSIGLTLLAIDYFKEDENDLKSLHKTMSNILDCFVYENEHATITKKLPTKPYSDVFAKMKEDKGTNMDKFHDRLNTAVTHLENAIDLSSEYEAAKELVKVFGEEFEIPEKDVKSVSKKNIGEHSFA